MSDAHCNELWLVTRKDLKQLLKLDATAQSSVSIKSRGVALNTVYPVYLKYRDVVRRLIICHDQMVQPQKRESIKYVLDCAIGRMLEYNREIVGLESNDYQWPDDLMIKMKITPDDVTIPVPKSYTSDRKNLLQQRRIYIEDLINKTNTNDEENQSQEVNIDQKELDPSEMVTGNNRTSEVTTRRTKRRQKTVEATKIQIPTESAEEKAIREAEALARKTFTDAIILIQAHERARAQRNLGKRAERQYNYDNKLATGELVAKKIPKKVKDNAATIIQKYWRGFAVRKMFKCREGKIEEVLDMTVPSWRNKSVIERDKENLQRRLSLQPEALSHIENITEKERARVFRIQGPRLMEDITDEIREWFLMWYDELGYFDAYPIAEVGGTILVATGQTLTPAEFAAQQLEKELTKSKKGEKEKATDKTKKESETKKSGKSKGGEEEFVWSMPENSKPFEGLVLAEDEFVKKWSLRRNKDNEPSEYLDLINEKLSYELQLEMREVVDELMRLELGLLNEALKKDHADDKPKFVNPTLGKKPKKKGKKKGKKDPTAGVSSEEMFKELVIAKVIHNYPEEHLDDWQGDLSYQNYEAKLELRDYEHRLGEIKNVVMNYCVLPLGSREVHAVAPLVRSVCICGLPGYGKSFLANAICTEVGALLFDLTPSVIAGQYEGKKNQDRLMNMIGKLAREYAPSIVFIDGGEKPWWKKIPLAERYTKPKRLAKLMPKFVKSIKQGDQVLFLTLSSEPQNATKAFIKIHDKFIIIPAITDYNTMYIFYKNLLMKYHGIDRNLDVSCLAKVSVGYPLSFVRQVVDNVLNVRRRIVLKFKPLLPEEILKELLQHETLPPKMLQQFIKFESRTTLGKNRAKIMNALKEEKDNSKNVKKRT